MYVFLCVHALYMFMGIMKCFNPSFMASRAVWEANGNCKNEWEVVVRDRMGIGLLLSLLSPELQKMHLERTRCHLLHPAAPRQDQFKLNCTWQIFIWLLLKTSGSGDSQGVRVVGLAAGWMFARSRLSCHWFLLCPVQDFPANLRNTGESGSVGWVVDVLVCSPGGLIDIFCVEMDCDTLCCDISESFLLNRVSWESV